ncbi:PREDICTED: uncharacterized protein LOC109174030 [Ipomoea nil]|uniref:uncharacterized protein LOC109174030 n=1 Tax=Ipomoea nil TaxID=35883 RepID=UPI000900B25C|nr:PREDICTED: uncharacterized protein LOC109174030 [Ipomoea nil]
MDAKIDKVAQSNQASIHNLEVQVGQLAKLVAEKDRALANMPSYAKYIKEIVSNKKKLEEFATVHLNEECSAILQSKLPPKLMDPGSFSIPCTIGNTVINKCLCDLGDSINLMPLTLFKKLEIAEMKPTTISLQLADRSVKYPLGVVEDILVKVGKFYFPVDFLILDMGSDTDTSLILGRPFLLTGGVLIDMPLGKLIFRVGKEKEEFSISKAVKFPTFDESCLFVHVIEKPPEEEFVKHSPSETPHQLELKPPSLRFKYEFLSNNDTFLMFSYAHLLHAKEERLWRTLTKAWHDKNNFWREFNVGQEVLLSNSCLKFFLEKLKSRWFGPFMVTKVCSYEAIEIEREK